jgi:hypothetical protein
MVNISSAFRLRNRLKERIQHLNGLIKGAPYEVTEGTEENRARLDGKTLRETIEESSRLMDLLCDFNKAIDKANAGNRIDLITLESLKVKISIYQQIAQSCRQCKGYDYEYPEAKKFGSDSEVFLVKKIPLVDQDEVLKTLNALKKAKNVLEEKLSSSNGRTMVDFDSDRIVAAL